MLTVVLSKMEQNILDNGKTMNLNRIRFLNKLIIKVCVSLPTFTFSSVPTMLCL